MLFQEDTSKSSAKDICVNLAISNSNNSESVVIIVVAPMNKLLAKAVSCKDQKNNQQEQHM